MAIDTLVEKLYPLPAIRQFLPESARTGRPVHPTVIARWITRGLKAKDGTVVHLEAVKAGQALCTSRESISRFFAELTRRENLPPSEPTILAETKPATSGGRFRKEAAAGMK